MKFHPACLPIVTLAFIAMGLTAAEPRDFRVADTQSNDHPTARALVHMSELVSDRTQGRHRMIVYPGGYWARKEQASNKRVPEESTLVAPTWLP